MQDSYVLYRNIETYDRRFLTKFPFNYIRKLVTFVFVHALAQFIRIKSYAEFSDSLYAYVFIRMHNDLANVCKTLDNTRK